MNAAAWFRSSSFHDLRSRQSAPQPEPVRCYRCQRPGYVVSDQYVGGQWRKVISSCCADLEALQ